MVSCRAALTWVAFLIGMLGQQTGGDQCQQTCCPAPITPDCW